MSHYVWGKCSNLQFSDTKKCICETLPLATIWSVSQCRAPSINLHPKCLSSHDKFFLEKESFDTLGGGDIMKGSPEMRVRTKGTSWNWNMKDNFMVRYCDNCTFLEEVYFEKNKKFQISLSLWVEFYEPVAKTYILSNLQLSFNYLT